MLREIWFWSGIIGVIFAGLLSFDQRFITRKGKLKKRKNYDIEKPISIITFTEFGIVVAETAWRIITGRKSVVWEAFTEEIFYELILFSMMFLVVYAAILVVTIAIVDIAHIGLHQIMAEQDREEQKDALQELQEWLEDYDRKVKQASVDSEYETAMENCRAYELMNNNH